MERRKWESKQKFEIVLEGIKSGKISEICNRYQISQSVYYRWRDEFFEKGPKVFEMDGKDKEQQRLKKENTRLKTIIGDLTTELKKNEYE
jgi:transposase-like protein